MTVSRREFLKGGAALGGLASVSALPALADDSALFSGRGRWERLSIVSQHIKAGAFGAVFPPLLEDQENNGNRNGQRA